MPMRIIYAYKTVSINAILDVAAILPLKLQAADKYKTHEAKRLSILSFEAGNKNRFNSRLAERMGTV